MVRADRASGRAFQRKARIEAGGAGISEDLSFGLAGCTLNRVKQLWQKSKVAHGFSQLPVEGSRLKGGEEGVEFGQVGLDSGFLLLN